MVYIRDKYWQYLNYHESLTFTNGDIESITLSLSYPYMRRQLISIVYRPPTGSLQNYITKLGEILADVNFIKTDVVIVGDFNINYNQRHSRGYRLLKAFERETGVKQQVTNDTRTSIKFSSRIDLILTNMKDITKVFVCNNLISDHLPIAIIKKHKIAQKIQKWVTGQQYKIMIWIGLSVL